MTPSPKQSFSPNRMFPWCSTLAYWQISELSAVLQVHTFSLSLFTFYYYFLIWPYSLQDLSSLTRDWTQVPAMKAPSPIHWTTREFPIHTLLITGEGRPEATWSIRGEVVFYSHRDLVDTKNFHSLMHSGRHYTKNFTCIILLSRYKWDV